MGQIETVGKHRATVTQTVDNALVVTYHNTTVVRVTGSIGGRTATLNSGGWQAHTTKTRMDQAANQFGFDYHVFQKDFAWYVDTPKGTVPFVDIVEFEA